MALDGVNSNQGEGQQVQEDFGTYAARLNKTFPDRTTTIEEKERAIRAKKLIMAHPQCPAETKATLQKEINIIEGEIARIKYETSMNTSVFDQRDDLG